MVKYSSHQRTLHVLDNKWWNKQHKSITVVKMKVVDPGQLLLYTVNAMTDVSWKQAEWVRQQYQSLTLWTIKTCTLNYTHYGTQVGCWRCTQKDQILEVMLRCKRISTFVIQETDVIHLKCVPARIGYKQKVNWWTLPCHVGETAYLAKFRLFLKKTESTNYQKYRSVNR